ncbi:MAG: rhodanese-like domain-containing protein [Syntrophobacteraceae bacterium]
MRKAIAVPIFVLFALARGLIGEGPLLAASIKGSESAAHGFDSASYKIVNENSHPGARVMPLTIPADRYSPGGGGVARIAAGIPVQGSEGQAATSKPAASAPLGAVKLPERIGPMELRVLILDLPGTFELVDIRPAAQFADYSIPGSRNVDIADAMQNPALLKGPGPLILVDRDGSLAMAVGGVLSQKSQRVIKVLHGGLQAYWEQTEKSVLTGQSQGGSTLTPGATSGKVPSSPGVPVSPVPSGPQDAPKAAPTDQETPAPPKPETKPKSAGC